MIDHLEFDDHEQLTWIHDRTCGLRALVAMHRLRGGRAGGGIRFQPYPSHGEALRDVLRLSKAMTWKFALAGVAIGGAKTVVFGDPAVDKTPSLLAKLGSALARDPRYLGGCDVGTTEADMDVLRRHGADVVAGSNTAIPTALGVLHGIRACCQEVFGTEDLSGRLVAVQGAGGVGSELSRLLSEAGAQVLLADVDESRARDVEDRLPVTVVGADQILAADVDILSPCALGGVFDDQSIPKLRCRAICGGANNQLAEHRHAQQLARRGITFAPDYVVSAGGLLAGTAQQGQISDEERDRGIVAIYDRLLDVFARAKRDRVTNDQAARELAEEIVAADQ